MTGLPELSQPLREKPTQPRYEAMINKTMLRRSIDSELTTRDKAVQSIMVSLEARKNPVKSSRIRYHQLKQSSSNLKLPSISRPHQGSSDDPDREFDLNSEIEQFEKSKKLRGPFSELSRLESKLLRDGEGYMKLKEIKKNPRYPFILTDVDEQQ